MNKEQEYRTYEFEYLSEVKLRDRRSTNCFMSAIDLKVGDCVIIERENRGIFLGRIIGAYDCECNTDYILVGKSGEVVSAYIDAVDKEKRRTEIANELEERIANLDKARKFEYYATLEGWHAAQAAMHDGFRKLYNEYKELC